MVLPNKAIKPIDSLFCISSYVLSELGSEEHSLDEILDQLNSIYPKKVNIEELILCINYLYIVGKLECHNEVIKAKF